ncbi:MAG: hypothetical protein J5925_00230 [Clostridia bacterium]|nr:hypothetical protein [Clostridia bacterium]MBR5745919.1 hypothetical protein [Clostridia bacterium]
MKTRLFALLLAALLLCGCTAKPDYAPELNAAVQNRAAAAKLGGECLLEISVAGSATPVYYLRGSFSCDKEAQTAFLEFDQTWLGQSSKAFNYYSGGVVTNITDGEEFTQPREANELLAKFPYFAPDPHREGDGEITRTEAAKGFCYTYVRKNGAEFCESVIGGDIYALVPVLKQPQEDKTVYGDVAFTCAADGETLISYGCEFDVTLFDTPAYVPGYSVPEEEYTLKLRVTMRITYSDGEITVKSYEKSEE